MLQLEYGEYTYTGWHIKILLLFSYKDKSSCQIGFGLYCVELKNMNYKYCINGEKVLLQVESIKGLLGPVFFKSEFYGIFFKNIVVTEGHRG